MGHGQSGASTSRSLRQTDEFVNVAENADLIALTGELAGRRFTIDQRVELGRDPKLPIVVPGDDVSRRHAAIALSSGGEYVISDLDSRNGTLVNGVPIEVRVLRFGDKLQIGSRTLFVFAPHSTLEEQLIRWQRVEVIGQMAAGVIHDFANYITAIMGNIELLRQLLDQHACDEETLRETLLEMEGAASQGFRLTRKVLGLARDSGAPATPVDIRTVVEDAVRLTRRTLDDAIVVHVAVANHLRVDGDRTELLQVLINLILNARDAMPDGGEIRIDGRLATVSESGRLTAEQPEGRQRVMLTVADRGTGMDDKTRARIFEPLFTTKSAERGTGLGLSTVARIVEGHGGTISVYSSPGVGSTFTILLPPLMGGSDEVLGGFGGPDQDTTRVEAPPPKDES